MNSALRCSSSRSNTSDKAALINKYIFSLGSKFLTCGRVAEKQSFLNKTYSKFQKEFITPVLPKVKREQRKTDSLRICCSEICEIRTCVHLQVRRKKQQVLLQCCAYLHKDCKVSPILVLISKKLIVTFNSPNSLIIIIIIIP